jgi:hypothetical protein
VRGFPCISCIADPYRAKLGLPVVAIQTPIHFKKRANCLFEGVFDPGTAEIDRTAFPACMIEQHTDTPQQLFGHFWVDNFVMTLKNATLFALTGMLLWTVVLTIRLIINIEGVLHGIVPDIAVLSLLIEWLASLSLLVFFAVFHKSQ